MPVAEIFLTTVEANQTHSESFFILKMSKLFFVPWLGVLAFRLAAASQGFAVFCEVY